MGNLRKDKLNASKLGVFFGTFAPLHLGHYQNIMQAKKENDACLVIVSGYKGDRGDLIGLDLTKRFRYTRELFADDENVYVTMLNEDNIPAYPLGWIPWLEKANQLISSSTMKLPSNITWYVGEKEYKDKLNELCPPSHKVRMLDRSTLPISATMIRESPLKHWDYISRPFRRHFSKNFLIMGTASGGKTTLTRDLARSFGSPFSLEYARQYEEESNVRDEELNANDFNYIASGQFDLNRKTIMSPSNNGMFFSDTNVGVTKVYSEYYLSKEEHKALMPMYDMLLAKERWDFIFLIPPITKYVDDGFRDMSYSGNEERWGMHERMCEMIVKQGWSKKVVLLDAKGTTEDPEGYYARYSQAREAVKSYIKNKEGIDLP